MIRHKLTNDYIAIVHEAKIEIAEEKLKRINDLLDIFNLTKCSEKRIQELNAKPNDYEGVFSVTFDDGSVLTWDLCSGSVNYYDNVVFTHNGTSETLDCSYELDDIQIDIGTDIYNVWVKPVKQGNQPQERE